MFKKVYSRMTGLIASVMLLLMAGVMSASAETLMMPDRDAIGGEQVVVWGVSDLPNGTAYSIDFGDGSPVFNGNVADRSYIATTHTYAANAAPYTATLTVGAEVASVKISVFDDNVLSAFDERQIRINMAIEDGLRRLWVDQNNRATNFPDGVHATWGSGSYVSSETAFVVAAFQNQGYKLPNMAAVEPSGVYEKYVVERGIHYVIASLTTQVLGDTPQGDNPCVGVPIDGDECVGLYDRRTDTFHQSYTTGVAAIAKAASGALDRTVALADVPGNLSSNFVVGRTYGDILQRMVNALAWGQIDGSFCTGVFQGGDRGGWYYNFNNTSSDGSTIGWVLLGLLDAEAAGINVPDWVKTEFEGALDAGVNNDGSLDYQANCAPDSASSTGTEKNGISLQGMFFTGELAGARRDSVVDNVNSWIIPPGIGGNSWGCNVPSGNENLGCGYTMYNNFKGLRLQGIQTLPEVPRAAGPGSIPANDWYAWYVDWFLANQDNPTSTTGGGWGPVMRFSPIGGIEEPGETAIAELILANVALILPDPDIFETVGLSPETQDIDLDTADPDEATVTAKSVSSEGTPIPGVEINFLVLSGPSAGETGSGISDADGEVEFTFPFGGDPNVGGVDEVQAYIGEVGSDIPSNIVDVRWIGPNSPPVAVCQDVVRECVANAFTDDVTAESFDGGSNDPDGDPLSFSYVPNPPLPLSPVGSTIGTLTVEDPSSASDQCLASFIVEDTTPPVVTAELIPLGNGQYEVNAEADDACGAGLVVVTRLRAARCGAVQVVDGQIIDFESIDEGKCSVGETNDGFDISAKWIRLIVTATDNAGNASVATATVNGAI